MKNMKNIITAIIALVGLSLCSPSVSRAASPIPFTPQTATEAVFFTMGMVEAQGEAAESVAASVSSFVFFAPQIGRVSFRSMAYSNALTATLTANHPVVSSYFWGRAAAFHQMADLEGEE